MPRPRRSLLRRYRLFAPRLFRYGLLLLALLLLCDGIAALNRSQIQAALSPNAPARGRSVAIGVPTLDPAGADSVNSGGTVLASDTFQRASQTYWGVASDGLPWQADAGNERNFVIENHVGIVYSLAQPVYCTALLGPVAANADLMFSAALSSYGNGASSLGAILRWSSPDDFYTLYLDGQDLVLAREMDGMPTPLQMIPFPARDGAAYTFRLRAVGTQLFAMVWPTGQPAPANWQIALTDSALSAGRAGIRMLLRPGTQARITSFMEVKV
jgi:hypothetical protein